MIKIKRSKALGKEIRQDDVPELAIPTWTLVDEALKQGKIKDVAKFMKYGLAENRLIHDMLVSMANMAVSHIATSGEEELEKIFRARYYPRVQDWLATTPGPEESLQRLAELHRGHYSNITITEEPDRYVMRLDPCGSCGRLRRTMAVETSEKAYPWTWGKSGVSYYCTHCSLFMEILPIEQRGYPICIIEYGDNPDDPCDNLFYKKPELIPEKYFTRVGKNKTIK